jgi:NAD-dependent dihydropyrimidine dehydrogenase PreA subunit
MPYVITGTCTKDEHCIETCPVNGIHPGCEPDGMYRAKNP